MIEWFVYYHDVNRNEIVKFNIFKHSTFAKEIEEHINHYKDIDTFTEEVRKSLMYYFWSKCEYEVLVKNWCGRDAEIKIDVYEQVMMNFDAFINHIIKNALKRKD